VPGSSKYPKALDGIAADKGSSTDAREGKPTSGPEGDHSGHHNALAAGVNAVQETLGINPQGKRSTVAERMGVIESEVEAGLGELPEDIPSLGEDGTVGGPGGSPLSPSVGSKSEIATKATILEGNGEPSTEDGDVGDYYLDKLNAVLYGPKAALSGEETTWGVGLPFGGPEEISVAGGLRGEAVPSQFPQIWQNTGTGFTSSANHSKLIRWVPVRAWDLTLVAWVVSTAAGSNDPCEIVLRDHEGKRLATTGAITGKLNSIGVKTATLEHSVEPGSVYYVEFIWGTVGGTAATIAARSITDANVALGFGSGYPLQLAGGNSAAYPSSENEAIGATPPTSVPILFMREI
jgi:hypothetical protein